MGRTRSWPVRCTCFLCGPLRKASQRHRFAHQIRRGPTRRPAKLAFARNGARRESSVERAMRGEALLLALLLYCLLSLLKAARVSNAGGWPCADTFDVRAYESEICPKTW